PWYLSSWRRRHAPLSARKVQTPSRRRRSQLQSGNYGDADRYSFGYLPFVICRRRRLSDGRKFHLKRPQMRAHGVSCALRVARFDHAEDLVVPALLAGAKGGLDILGGTIERLQYFGIVVADGSQHRRQHGVVGRRRDCQVEIDARLEVLTARCV